jgi:tetratricopeptide (TPR) repeat protein
MTRPRRQLALIVVFVVAALVVAPRLPDGVLWAAAAVGGVLVVLGAVAGRRLFQGRSLMSQGRWEDAALELAAFEAEQSRAGWRRALAFLFVGTFSSDGLAVARGTLGALRLEQGRWDDAQRHLERALEQDPDYAVAHANLALLAARRGDVATAERHRAKAWALGFRRRAFQRALAEALGRPPAR